MGKRHFKGNNKSADRNLRREKAEKWKTTRGDENRGYDTPATNPRFEAFYKAQGFVGQHEWENFLEALRSPLPACFRINHDYIFADQIAKELEEFAGRGTITVDGTEIRSVEKLDWYPLGLGYKLGTDRRSLRKLPELQQLHRWMIKHTDMGNITRQEAVSMVPPLALDVQPHHRCLDMCAAPGSKTSQLLEVIDKSLFSTSGGLNSEGQGCVVANDADTDRAYMLVHQCKRINSPLLVVTTHQGQLFPRIENELNTRDGYFDRVLCDVPCTGDGTMRKNPCIWAKWTTANGMSLHPLQLQIASRGLQLLKTGGLMVYSTCSMSPYENEAVVAELLRNSNGTLELVDARQLFLPKFKARPGLHHWYVLNDYGAIKKAAYSRKVEGRKEKQSTDVDVAADSEAVSEGTSTIPVVVDSEAVVNMDLKEEKESSPATDDATETSTNAGGRIPRERVRHENPLVDECLQQGMDLYSSFNEVPEWLQKKVRKSLFPPTEEELKWMKLEHCLRCVPHDEDTGGFFVATLRKKPISNDASVASASTAMVTDEDSNAELDTEAINAATGDFTAEENTATVCRAEEDDDNNEDEGDEQAPKKLKTSNPGEKDVVVAPVKQSAPQHRLPAKHGLVEFKNWDLESFSKVKEFYGISDALSFECMFVRDDVATAKDPDTQAKSVYFIPPSVCDLLRGDKERRLKIVCAGIKVFEKKVKSQNDIEYRIVQEGVHAIMPYITSRKIFVTAQDFSNLLGGGLVSFNTLSANTIELCSQLGPGAVICVYKFSPEDVISDADSSDLVASAAAEGHGNSIDDATTTKHASLNTCGVSKANVGEHTIYAICWRGTTRTLNVMCGKTEIESMRHQLSSLKVLRPKICVPKRPADQASAARAAVELALAAVTNDDAAADEAAQVMEVSEC